MLAEISPLSGSKNGGHDHFRHHVPRHAALLSIDLYKYYNNSVIYSTTKFKTAFFIFANPGSIIYNCKKHRDGTGIKRIKGGPREKTQSWHLLHYVSCRPLLG